MPVLCPKCHRSLQDEDSECKCNIDGRWLVELWASCPFCDTHFEVMKTDDYKNGGWENFEDCFAQTSDQVEYELECPSCHEKLFMNRTEY